VIGVIAVMTLREIAQRRLSWVLVGLGLAFLVVYGVGLWAIEREVAQEGAAAVFRGQAASAFFVVGLYVINFLVLVLGVIVSVDTLSGEIASGTVHTIVTKPLRRADVVLGKLVGHLVVVGAFLAVMGLGAHALVGATLGPVSGDLVPALALMLLEAVIVLGLSYLGGALTGTLANGLVVFMLYALALVGSWIERIGAALGSASAQYVGIVASLLMPTEVLWQRAAWGLLPPLFRQVEFGFTPFTAANQPSPAMIGYAGLYALAAVALAVRAFSRRDL